MKAKQLQHEQQYCKRKLLLDIALEVMRVMALIEKHTIFSPSRVQSTNVFFSAACLENEHHIQCIILGNKIKSLDQTKEKQIKTLNDPC